MSQYPVMQQHEYQHQDKPQQQQQRVYWKEIDGRPEAIDHTLRQTLKEQHRLESQIAFLRRQLMKNNGNDDHDHDHDADQRWESSSDESPPSPPSSTRRCRRYGADFRPL